MPNVPLQPGQSHTFHDTEGGSDLVIKNNNASAGRYTYAVNNDPARPHNISPNGSQVYEVADDQSATVNNTGSVALLVEFADSARAGEKKAKKK